MHPLHRTLILTTSIAALSLAGCSSSPRVEIAREDGVDYVYIPPEDMAQAATDNAPSFEGVADEQGDEAEQTIIAAAPVTEVIISDSQQEAKSDGAGEAAQIVAALEPVTEEQPVEQAEEESGEFDMASATDDAQLSDMRGGFVSMGGLMINFGLVSTTAVNDVVVNKLELSTVGLNGLLPSNLQQLLQNGNGNQAAVSSNAVPYNVLTVVQNTASNQLIQNQNVLDITVGNLSAFRDQQIAFSQRFVIGSR